MYNIFLKNIQTNQSLKNGNRSHEMNQAEALRNCVFLAAKLNIWYDLKRVQKFFRNYLFCFINNNCEVVHTYFMLQINSTTMNFICFRNYSFKLFDN